MSVLSVSTSAPFSVLYLRRKDSATPCLFESSQSSLVTMMGSLGFEPPKQWGGSAVYDEHAAVIDNSSAHRKVVILKSVISVTDISGHCVSTSCQHYVSLIMDEEGEIRVRMKSSEIVKVLRWLTQPIPRHFGGASDDTFALDACKPIQRRSPRILERDQQALILENPHEIHDFYIDPVCKSGPGCTHYCQVMNGGTWSDWMRLTAKEVRGVLGFLGRDVPEHFHGKSLPKNPNTLRDRRALNPLKINT